MNLFLLQEDVAYFKEDDPTAGFILIGILGAFILIFVISSFVKGGLGGGKSSSGSGGNARHFSIFAMHRVAKTYGLNRDQAKALEFVLRSNGVIDPERTVENPGLLDKHFKRSFKQMEKSIGSEEEAQQRMSLLFSVRNAIDIHHNTSAGSSGTQRISSGMTAVLSVNQDSFSVKVISSKGDTVLVDCPRNAIGTLIKFPRGTRVNLAFFSRDNKGFSFDSQVVGLAETSFGPALQLFHTQKAKAMTKRRFRRTNAVVNCDFFLVRVEDQKNKKSPKMTVDSRRFSGTVTDISIGGCAIKTQLSVAAGSRIKIEFDYARSSGAVAVLGLVLRTNRSGISNTIMHIKFLKVPRKAMNAINTLVFEYGV